MQLLRSLMCSQTALTHDDEHLSPAAFNCISCSCLCDTKILTIHSSLAEAELPVAATVGCCSYKQNYTAALSSAAATEDALQYYGTQGMQICSVSAVLHVG